MTVPRVNTWNSMHDMYQHRQYVRDDSHLWGTQFLKQQK